MFNFISSVKSDFNFSSIKIYDKRHPLLGDPIIKNLFNLSLKSEDSFNAILASIPKVENEIKLNFSSLFLSTNILSFLENSIDLSSNPFYEELKKGNKYELEFSKRFFRAEYFNRFFNPISLIIGYQQLKEYIVGILTLIINNNVKILCITRRGGRGNERGIRAYIGRP